jgi:hypothetical protein
MGRPKPILEGNPSMMLHLGGSPSLPHNSVHIGVCKPMDLKLVGRRLGILSIICELPNNIILLQKNIVGKRPKMLQGESGLQIYFSDPSIPMKNLRNRPLLSIRGFKNLGGNIFGSPSMKPRSMPKLSLPQYQ